MKKVLFFIILILLALPITVTAFNLITGGATSGTAGISLVILGRDNCTIVLKPGFNHISICQDLPDKSVSIVFAPVYNNLQVVLEWDENNQNFKSFSPLSNSNGFTTLNENKSYFVYMDTLNDIDFNVTNTDFGNMNISLVQGFNSPSFPYKFTQNITNVTESVFNDVGVILKWNTTIDKFQYFSPNSQQNEFTEISTGEGYMLFINNPLGALLEYNKTKLQP